MHEWTKEDEAYDRRRNRLGVAAITVCSLAGLAVNTVLDVTLNEGVVTHKVVDGVSDAIDPARAVLHDVAEWVSSHTEG